MGMFEHLCDWLASIGGDDADEILTAALEHAEPQYAERICEMLLARGSDAAFAGLVSQYPALSYTTRSALHTSPDRLRNGIALAMRFSAPTARANTLMALQQDLSPKLAYLLPPALHDPSATVRGLAGDVLSKLGRSFLDRPPPDANSPEAAEYAQERAQLGQALREALASFDRHLRVEVLQLCVYMNREVGELLWAQIEDPRGRVGAVIADHLETWASPQAAHFLLSALTQARWAGRARRILKSWQSAEEMAALLSESALLDEPEVGRGVAAIQAPHWPTALTSLERALDPHRAAMLPRWISVLRIDHVQKCDLLTRWAQTGGSELRLEAVSALARLADSRAAGVLARCAAREDAAGVYARWLTAGSRVVSGAATMPPEPANPRASDFTLSWHVARRARGAERVAAIRALRQQLHAVKDQVVAYIDSPDPRDRALALHVLCGSRAVAETQVHAQRLCRDPDPLVQAAAASCMSIGAYAAQGAIPPAVQAAWSELDPILHGIVGGDAAGDLRIRDHVQSLMSQGALHADGVPEWL